MEVPQPATNKYNFIMLVVKFLAPEDETYLDDIFLMYLPWFRIAASVLQLKRCWLTLHFFGRFTVGPDRTHYS